MSVIFAWNTEVEAEKTKQNDAMMKLLKKNGYICGAEVPV